MIWTNSEQLAQEYIFEKKEQFVFIKYITRKEIGAVKIVKTPVLDFKDIEQSEEIIELGIGEDVAEDLLKDYLNWKERPEIWYAFLDKYLQTRGWL